MTPFLLHQLLDTAANHAPDAAAVYGAGRRIDYAELADASSRLAAVLHGHGIRPGDRIGIDLDKGPEAVIAMFGILKAGAAYVPLDPKAPPSRAAFIVGNCEMSGLITRQARWARLKPALDAVPGCVVVLDRDGAEGTHGWSEVEAAAPTAPEPDGQTEQDLAYILYTSGSTGVPKGVMISHRAALTFVNWAVDYFSLAADDHLSSHAPLHFDLSVFDIFGAVAAGAAVHLVPQAATIFPRNLCDWMAAEAITTWYSVPSALVQLALNGGLDRHPFPALRRILFAGEVFPVRHLRRLMEQLPHPCYYNLYGPTETNVCTVHDVVGAPAEDAAPLPIGRACANTEVFALDDAGQAVAPGGTGELYVRGPALMRGYWARPDLTAQYLVADPRRGTDAVYRTGDVVRLDPDGDYHFIGRRDLQVKSRGYRIELGDVEAVLHRHPAVAEAAVVPVPHEEFGCTLRAVIVARAGEDTGRAAMSAFCADQLPPYMIPAEFHFADALPKTSSGKLDRRALQTGDP